MLFFTNTPKNGKDQFKTPSHPCNIKRVYLRNQFSWLFFLKFHVFHEVFWCFVDYIRNRCVVLDFISLVFGRTLQMTNALCTGFFPYFFTSFGIIWIWKMEKWRKFVHFLCFIRFVDDLKWTLVRKELLYSYFFDIFSWNNAKSTQTSFMKETKFRENKQSFILITCLFLVSIARLLLLI